MAETARRRAIRNYRRRLAERGMARFEVLGRAADRELVRSFGGRSRNALDTIIAATARANGCIVVTDNEKDFIDLGFIDPVRGAIR